VREVKAEEVGDLFDRQAARLAVRDELAILVPFKNRERYLAHLLRGLPAYLERTGVRDYHIYVAEQDGDDMLNVALARNVAAAFCLARAAYPTLVFHNVDVIPVENVDYGFDHNQSWFLDAGSCKVRGRDFLSANGYNPAFVGWGGEDVEFYHRLDVLGLDCREWHREEGSRRAVVANLELPPLDDAGALDWSRHYFGHAGGGPRFVSFESWSKGGELQRYDKSLDFLQPAQRAANDALWHRIFTMPRAQKLCYFAANGLNRVDISSVAVEARSERVTSLRYRTREVLRPAAAEREGR
jgi:hypothetical protein